MNRPKLSLIIPVLNESKTIIPLLDTLSSQSGIFFELILVDGGSTDDTILLINNYKETCLFPLTLVSSDKGRAKQFNSGFRQARYDLLLFLHADCFFNKSSDLLNAVDSFLEKLKNRGHNRIAGRFAVRFKRNNNDATTNNIDLFYLYYETKTQLRRIDCINGDQGVLIIRSFFLKVGTFDESLPFLEDKKFAQAVYTHGMWMILDGELFTSARRFEQEGMAARQVLNAIILNFNSIGWDPFLHSVLGIYKSQDNTQKLNLYPFFKKIKKLFSQESFFKRVSLWYATGGYVSANIWQIALFFDVRRAYRKKSTTVDRLPLFSFFDTHIAHLQQNPVVCFFTMIVTWVWFNWVYVYTKSGKKKQS